MPPLSKSRYVSGLQCAKRLWYEVNAREQVPPLDEATRAILEQGQEVGRLAQRLVPGGVEIARGAQPWAPIVAATRRAMAARIPVYEAAFVHEGGACRVDILAPVGREQWDLLEVKSSTGTKDVHFDDLAFQTWVARGAGVPVRRSCLVRIDSTYERHGPLDPERLFVIEDLTAEIETQVSLVPPELARQQAIAALPAAPEIPIGPHCTVPYSCPLMPICWRDVPESSVLELTRGGAKVWELYRRGVASVGAIPPGVELSRLQRIQVDAARSGVPRIDRAALASFLERLAYPVHYLDFETFQVALPPFDGTRPWQQIPFQFSLHVVEAPGAPPRATAFLADGEGEPRPAFLEALRAAIGPSGSIVAYHERFERQRLEEAAAAFPAHHAWIEAVLPRFVDLLEPFKKFDYYHPEQNGSASLKAVLPILGARGYEHLEVQEGSTAAREFLRLRNGDIERAERERIQNALLDYCGRDTEGMVEIVEALRRIVDDGG